jgi:5'(3')-deoxyribonucleotidase
MPSKKTIAVDIDDVLSVSTSGFINFSNQQWGTNLTVDDYTERWGIMWKVDAVEEQRRAKIIYDSGVVHHFGSIKGAQPVLRHLAKDYNLVVASSRMRQLEKATMAWLDEHFKDVFSAIHFAGFYDELADDSQHHTKAELCRSIGADYLIDDHPKHCFAVAGVGIPAILFGDNSWSRGIKLPKGVYRALDWAAVKEYFDGLS